MGIGRRAYTAVFILLLVAHPLLPAAGRDYTFVLCGALGIPPLIVRLRRHRWLPSWLLLIALVVLSASNVMTAFGGAVLHTYVPVLVSTGHVLLLSSAIALVLRRGRNDIGGMLDVAVAAMAFGGVFWTALLFPKLQSLHAEVGTQITVLFGILALSGVLGALLRLWFAGGRLPALGHYLTGLTFAWAGNVVLARTTGELVDGQSGILAFIFMISYGFVGLAVLHPTSVDLMTPSSAPADRLSTGRLVMLGLALVATPAATGIRVMLGLDADGPLLVLGGLLLTTLVMIRVGRLARQHEGAERWLRHQATHDPLTGLPNRAELTDRLAAALDRERVAGRPSVVLLFCDLNGFKQVNDQLGHEAGDQVLTAVAARIRAGLRTGDTLARYGGDEFLLLCEDDDPDAAARRLTDHVERALAEPLRLDGEPVTIGSSVGAVISGGDLGADELISRADQAMYRAKHEHRALVPAPRR